MDDTTETATAKQAAKSSEPEGIKAKEEASPLKPDDPSKSKERNATNSKVKRCACKKPTNDYKKKAKRHPKILDSESSSDSDDSSSDSSSSYSTDDTSESSSSEEEAARRKRRSRAKRAKKLKTKKKAKAKAREEDTDSDDDDESDSEEEEKKKSKRKKQLKKKKRARKSKEVEEEDEEDEDDDVDDDGNAAFNRQQLAQLQAMNLKLVGRGRVGRGSSGETVNVNGELGKKNAKAKGKPGKRLVFRNLSSIKPREVATAPVPCKVSPECSPHNRSGVCAD